jgi:lysophospholipase L1-like esterase
MVAGDSLAGGYYTTTEDKQFRKLVSAELSKHGATEEVKAAQSGANLSTVGGLVGIPKDLGLAVIELGTNDTAGKTAVEAFAQQYDSLLRSVKEGSPNVGIICVGPWGAPGAGTDPYDVAVETSCKKAGGQFVKISTVFAGLENRSKKGDPSWLGPSDAFHPNDLGHERIADLILERIKVS